MMSRIYLFLEGTLSKWTSTDSRSGQIFGVYYTNIPGIFLQIPSKPQIFVEDPVFGDHIPGQVYRGPERNR